MMLCSNLLCKYPRFNEAKLKQLAVEQGLTEHRKRASRMEKWRELAKVAAGERPEKDAIPDKIEWLDRMNIA